MVLLLHAEIKRKQPGHIDLKMNRVKYCLLLAALAASFPAMAEEKVLVKDTDGVVVTTGMLKEEIRFRLNVEKQLLLKKPGAKEEAINTLFRREKLLKAIADMGIADDPEVKYRLRMAEKDVLILAAREKYASQIKYPSFDDLARERYVFNKDEYVVKEQVRASHIFFSADNDGVKKMRMPEAEAVLARIEKGDGFEALAKEYSDDGSAAKGGDLGWFTRGKMVKPFEDAAFSLDEGEISNIVQTKFGLHIIRLEKRKQGRMLSFEEVAEKIKEELKDEYKKKKLRSWFKETTDPIDPIKNQALIDSIDLKAIE